MLYRNQHKYTQLIAKFTITITLFTLISFLLIYIFNHTHNSSNNIINQSRKLRGITESHSYTFTSQQIQILEQWFQVSSYNSHNSHKIGKYSSYPRIINATERKNSLIYAGKYDEAVNIYETRVISTCRNNLNVIFNIINANHIYRPHIEFFISIENVVTFEQFVNALIKTLYETDATDRVFEILNMEDIMTENDPPHIPISVLEAILITYDYNSEIRQKTGGKYGNRLIFEFEGSEIISRNADRYTQKCAISEWEMRTIVLNLSIKSVAIFQDKHHDNTTTSHTSHNNEL